MREYSIFFNGYKWIATVVFIGALIYLAPRVLKSLEPANAKFQAATLMPQGPSVMVIPFDVAEHGEDDDGQDNARLLKTGLHYETIHNLARFKDLLVLTGMDSSSTSLDNTKSDYYLTGSIQASDINLRVNAALARQTNDEIIWSKSYDETLTQASGILKIQTMIASDVARALGQPYGTINKEFAAELERNKKRTLPHQYCLMRFYDYLNAKTPEEHAALRDCLETTTRESPEFSSAWAARSWIYGDEARNQFNLRAQDTSPYERALESAEKAVSTDSENAMAYQYLAIAKFSLKDEGEFRKAAEMALSLNPNDSDVLADVGSHLIQLDNSEQGRLMVEKAIRLNPGHPPWYHGSIITYYYMRGQTEAALSHAEKYIQDDSLAAHVLLTVCLVQDGQMDNAKTRYQTLIKLYPHFKNQYDPIVEDWSLPEGMPESILHDLRLIGLGGA